MKAARRKAGFLAARGGALVALIPALAITCWSGGAQAVSPPLDASARAAASGASIGHADGSVEVAVLSEENLPPQDMPSPSATPGAAGAGATTEAPAQNGNNNDDWTRVPTAAPAASPTPAGGASEAPIPGQPSQAGQAGLGSATAGDGTEPSPEASPTEVPPPYDVGSVQPSPPVSDQPLTPLIDAAAKDQPALSASLRFVEQARNALNTSKADEAIRLLGRAVSIDPGDPYAFFFLGRAYMMKNDYAQALAFFGRSEVGLRANLAWLGEAKSYEGACLEQQNKLPEALQAYRDALQAAPDNLMARVGYGRLAAIASDASAGNQPPPIAPAVGADVPPPNEPPPPSAEPNSPQPGEPAAQPGAN